MQKKINLIFLLYLNAFFCIGQTPQFRYDVDYPSASFYKARRDELKQKIPDSSVAILFSAPEKIRSNDTNFPYHQFPNFYYLTGFTEANSILLIFKLPFSVGAIQTDEILFIAPRNKNQETWTGRLASIEDAQKISGIASTFLTSDFYDFDIKNSNFKTVLYQSLPAGVIDDKSDSTDLFNLVELFKRKFSYPPSNGDSYQLGKALSTMRETKLPEEISLMRKAILISCNGHKEMMKALQPGMSEYQVQAVGEFVFKNEGAEDVGYPSICGGGENSCILHYESNRKNLKDGDLILLDMGAEYHGYTADVTRTLPVNGKFNNEQKIIYNLVKQAQDSAFNQCIPGNSFSSTQVAASKVIKKGLLNLGITKSEDEYDDYFMHGTSHYLGLDAHDAGSHGKLKEGSVITVEPGIYIPYGSPCDPKWWNIGVRIEDDVLITRDGYENLSISCPSSIDEIELIMKQSSNLIANPAKKP